MIVEIINNDKDHFINEARCNGENFSWSSNMEESHFIIIRSEFGKKLENLDFIAKSLEDSDDIYCDESISASEFLSFSLFKRQLLLARKCTVKPARYSVYVCRYLHNENKLIIYLNDGHQENYCDVASSLDFNVIVERKEQSRSIFDRIFSRESFECQYAKVNLIGDNNMAYTDGALYYTFEGCKYKYPITKEMLSSGFYVPLFNGNKPIIKSYSSGFNARITDGV